MGWISACFIAVIVFADFSSTLPIPETSTSKPAKTRSILKRIRSTVDRSSNADSEITTTTPDPDDIELSLSNLFDIAPTVFEYRYAVIIDAGSSHTDLVIYKWSTDKINGTGIVTQENHVVCKAPLSAFKELPQDAGESLKDCMNFAALEVPKSQWANTPVLLGATAGMRVLQSNDPEAAEAILQSIRTYLRLHYDFFVEDGEIKILSPEQEGGFAWLAINYVKKILIENANYDADTRMPTWGSLDLGGASTQFSNEVTADTKKKIKPSFSLILYGHEYKVYTRSYLCYGKNEAHRRFKALLLDHGNFSEPIINPCRPPGFDVVIEHKQHFGRPCSNGTIPTQHYKEKYTVQGAANGPNCKALVQQLFRKTMDLNPSECPFQDGECTFKGIKKGTIRGRFLGTGALYYDTRNLRSVSGDAFSLDPFDPPAFRAARNLVCGKTHDQVEQLIKRRPELKEIFIRQCFDATYLEVLLGEVYNLSDQVLKNTTFAKKIDGVEVGWTLGWAVVASSDIPKAGYKQFVYT